MKHGTSFAELVTASGRVAQTRSRLTKIREIADCLRAVSPEAIPIAIAYLSGETRQGKLGVSYGSLQASRAGAAALQPSLSLDDVDAAFSQIAQIKGKGASAQRTAALT